MEIPARYYDGRTSRAREVRLRFDSDGSMRLLGGELNRRFALEELDIAPRIGNTLRAIGLPDGARCEVPDNDALDAMLRRHRRLGFQDWVHRLESRLVYVVIALLVTAAASWGMVSQGIPWLAERAARSLPASVDHALGEGTLEVLDRIALAPTELAAATRGRLQGRFEAMRRELDGDLVAELVFRKGAQLGANALALPSGIIVLTDELVALAQNDDELIAVIAHEIGHLVHRHSVRMAMQSSALALILAAVTGDPFSSSTLAATLPTLLLHARYSQEFEHEADDYAYGYLVAHEIPTRAFADILQRLGGAESEPGVEQYLSTHPATSERMERFLQQ